MLTITFQTDSAAHEEVGEAEEAARILREFADRFEAEGVPADGRTYVLRDINGARVGTASYRADD